MRISIIVSWALNRLHLYAMLVGSVVAQMEDGATINIHTKDQCGEE